VVAVGFSLKYMDRFTEGFLIGQMGTKNANARGCLAIICFGLVFLLLLLWEAAREPTETRAGRYYHHQQQEIQQEKQTHSEKDI
jgi:hypothetical protein